MKVAPTATLIVEEPVSVITGAIESISTTTVLFTEAVLPAASETLYDIVNVPVLDVLIAPEVVIEEVKSPSTSSVAVAPGSVQFVPTATLIIDAPVNVIDGGVVSSGEFTITVLVVETILLALSDTL